MLGIWRLCVIGIGLVSILLPMTAAAAESSKDGLSISPLRQEAVLDTGKKKSVYITVGNLSDKPMNVKLSVGQFSVAEYSYLLKLDPPIQEWVKPREAQKLIQPKRSEKVWFDIVAPEKATPGGYYFSLSASANLENTGLPQTVQATSLLYMTVNGKLIRTGVLQDASLPFFVWGNEIPYRFDVKDTGNVHFSAYFYGQLESLFGKYEETGTSHVLLPGVTRTIEGAIPAPLLPGIYKVEYGYKVDFASIIISKTAYILFMPPWSIVAALFLLLAGRWIWQKRRRVVKKKNKS